MKKIKCQCDLEAEAENSSPAEVKKVLPGWEFVWDVTNGLEMVWLCPLCAHRVQLAAEMLKAVFTRVPLRNVNFGPFLK